jgi:hypothetical protein
MDSDVDSLPTESDAESLFSADSDSDSDREPDSLSELPTDSDSDAEPDSDSLCEGRGAGWHAEKRRAQVSKRERSAVREMRFIGYLRLI